ncbi:MAG: SAM-dependent methyltransferase [Flavobacteriales bacterium]
MDRRNASKTDKTYWNERFNKGRIGWDIGHAAPALLEYVRNTQEKNARILIPGCGHAYEAEVLFPEGFWNIHLLDLAPTALENFRNRNPDFPEAQIHEADFFEHEGPYDLILEQTFFCSLEPKLRPTYVEKTHELLVSSGRSAGLLFDADWKGGPPYSGTKGEYEELFQSRFRILKLERSRNSIPPRQGSELFFELQKP